MNALDRRVARHAPSPLWLVAAAVLALAGCGASNRDTSSSQVAARVNKDEVTVHQINHALQSQRGLRPDQAEFASNRILERLIDQQLAVQKAAALQIDRDPRVLQQLEASRNEIIARTYFDKIAEGVAKPTPEEVTAYYNENPSLFRERRVYQLQEMAIQTPQGTHVEAIQRIVGSGKPVDELLIYLRANQINYTTSQVVRAAEQVPLATLPSLSRLKAGQSLVVTGASGVQVVTVVESRLQPIDEERARPAIEQFMVNDRKRRVVAEDVKALRAAAKVEYVGKFAASAPAAGDEVPNLADVAASAARGMPATTGAGIGTVAASSRAPAQAASAPEPAASGLSNSIINKGLGLK